MPIIYLPVRSFRSLPGPAPDSLCLRICSYHGKCPGEGGSALSDWAGPPQPERGPQQLHTLCWRLLLAPPHSFPPGSFRASPTTAHTCPHLILPLPTSAHTCPHLSYPCPYLPTPILPLPMPAHTCPHLTYTCPHLSYTHPHLPTPAHTYPHLPTLILHLPTLIYTCPHLSYTCPHLPTLILHLPTPAHTYSTTPCGSATTSL